MIRAGHFRHRLLDEDFLNKFSGQAYCSLQPFLELWKKGELQDVEMVAVYIWIFSFLRRPQDFLGGPHQERLIFKADPTHLSSKRAMNLLLESLKIQAPTSQLYSQGQMAPSMALPEEKTLNSLRCAKSLKRFETDQGFLPFFCSLSWRSIPFAASRSVCQWHKGEYPLKLLTRVPSADEVLVMQTQGWRCVSMLIEKHEIAQFVHEGRDVFGFVLHDLIHADHFFFNRENASAQIYFSQKLLAVKNLPLIQEMMDLDPMFISEFHYLMSDMNSVPLHLLKSLKAVLLGYFKRRDGISMTSTLTEISELEFRDLFQFILKPWSFSVEALAAVHRLNTPAYQTPHDSFLLDGELRPSKTSHSLSTPGV